MPLNCCVPAAGVPLPLPMAGVCNSSSNWCDCASADWNCATGEKATSVDAIGVTDSDASAVTAVTSSAANGVSACSSSRAVVDSANGWASKDVGRIVDMMAPQLYLWTQHAPGRSAVLCADPHSGPMAVRVQGHHLVIGSDTQYLNAPSARAARRHRAATPCVSADSVWLGTAL